MALLRYCCFLILVFVVGYQGGNCCWDLVLRSSLGMFSFLPSHFLRCFDCGRANEREHTWTRWWSLTCYLIDTLMTNDDNTQENTRMYILRNCNFTHAHAMHTAFRWFQLRQSPYSCWIRLPCEQEVFQSMVGNAVHDLPDCEHGLMVSSEQERWHITY